MKLETEIAKLQLVEESIEFSSMSAEEMNKLTSKYHNILRQSETFWRQKSRISWLKDGDSNTNFFHKATVCRRARNLIKELTTDGGEIISSSAGWQIIFLSIFERGGDRMSLH